MRALCPSSHTGVRPFASTISPGNEIDRAGSRRGRGPEARGATLVRLSSTVENEARRDPWAAAFAAVLLSAILVGCGSKTGTGLVGSPAPQGAAFDMVALEVVPCPQRAVATICVKVKVTNLGDMAGDGVCRLVVTTKTAAGQDREIYGGRLAVHDVPPGGTAMRVVPWTKKPPDPPLFGGDCTPGPRL